MKENFFSLIIYVTVDRLEKVDKAENEELVLGVTADVHGDAVTGTRVQPLVSLDTSVHVHLQHVRHCGLIWRRQPRQTF